MTWVPSWDDSFEQANLATMHKAGYKVLAGYVAGGTADKWSSATRIKQWLAFGDTGFMPLFEAGGKEPVTNPSLGDDHAKAARAGARARGIADSISISPAVDLDITMAQAKGAVATYLRLWHSADTVPATPYVEGDAGLYLFSAGLTDGTFVPAAWGWNDPAKLYTSANAASHMIALQEHNSKNIGGGNVDVGEVRLGAKCVWWAKPAPVKPPVKPAPGGHAPGSRTLIYAPGHAVMNGADVKFVQTFIGPKHCGAADSNYGPTSAEGVSWYEDLRGIGQERPYGQAGPQVFHEMGVKYAAK